MDDEELFNITNRTKIPAENYLSVEKYFVSSLYIAIAVTSVLGNILVILAVYSNRRLQTTSNVLLVALAVPDFFQGAVSIPLRLVEVLNTNCDHKTLCRVAIPVSILFGGTSNLHILLIAIERFTAIFWPYFYQSWITTKSVLMGVGAAWISMIAFSLLPEIGWGGKEPKDLVVFCRFPRFLTQDYITCLYVFVHAIPIASVLFFNIFILRASLDHARRIGAQVIATRFNSQIAANGEFDPDQSEEVRKRRSEANRQRKATRTVTVIVGSFILLVVPITTIDMVEMVTDAVVPVWIVKITVIMIYANHCVNVFVYAGFNRDYRKSLIKIITCIKRATANVVPMSSSKTS